MWELIQSAGWFGRPGHLAEGLVLPGGRRFRAWPRRRRAAPRQAKNKEKQQNPESKRPQGLRGAFGHPGRPPRRD